MNDAELEILRERLREEVDLEETQKRIDAEFLTVRLDGSRIEPGDIEQADEQAFQCLHRRLHLSYQSLRIVLRHALAQDFDEKADRLHGLAKIMARRREKPRLGGIRALGF